MTTIAAAFLLAINAAQASAPEDVRIVLSRTGCFGGCPVYTVSVAGNGAVRYDGLNYVRVTGTQKWTIDPAAARALADEIERAGFFQLKDEYTAHGSDFPTTIVTLTRGTRTKTVKDEFGAPPALTEIEARIDRASGARGYVFVNAAAIGDLRKNGWRAETAEGARWMREALLTGDAEVVRALLKAGYNARAADDSGVTLVMQAASSGDAETVRAVLAAGGDPTARDKRGRNAADRARDGLADAARPNAGHLVVYATGKPCDYALVLRLLTDE